MAEKRHNHIHFPQKPLAVTSVAIVTMIGAGDKASQPEAEASPNPATMAALGGVATANPMLHKIQTRATALETEAPPKVVKIKKQKSTRGEIISVHPDYSKERLSWLFRLRMCESHNDYTLTHDNSGYPYEGAYQFSPSTWRSLRTGYDHAYQAPPKVQDKAIIKNTKRSPGGISTQNPGCYSKLGLSKFPPK